MLDAVLFDMDGLLLDTERAYMDGFLALSADRDMPNDRQSYLQMIGLNDAGVLRKLSEWLGSDAAAAQFYEAWGAHVRPKLETNLVVKSGVVELLHQLSHLPKAVVTSSRVATAHEALELSGLLPHFQVVIGGDMVTHPKPDPEPYLRGAQELGIAIERCAAFEDSATGIRAAVASGARAVQIPDLVSPSDEIRALGHIIAPDILSGARAIGLI